MSILLKIAITIGTIWVAIMIAIVPLGMMGVYVRLGIEAQMEVFAAVMLALAFGALLFVGVPAVIYTLWKAP